MPNLSTAILDFCTRLDDGPRNEAETRKQLPHRDPAEYQWLREALESIEQPERRLKTLLGVVSNESADRKALLEALEEILDAVEDLNMATEFVLMKGHAIIITLLRSTADIEIRRLSAGIIAAASQNHQKVQNLFVEEGCFNVLIPLLVNEQDAGTRSTIAFAIASLCRGCDHATAAFLKCGGLGALLAIIVREGSDSKTLVRCLNLAAYFAEVHSTTALPFAAISCSIGTRELSSSSLDEAEKGVVDAAADCAATILKTALSTGSSGADIARSMVEQLKPWYDATRDKELASEQRRLRAVYDTAVLQVPRSEGAPPSAMLHTPPVAVGWTPPLALAASPPS